MTFTILLTGIVEYSRIAKLVYLRAVIIKESKKETSVLSQCTSL